MNRLLAMLFVIVTTSSCTNYYEGKVSDHFDGSRFFDPEIQNKKTFGAFLKWQITRKSVPWPNRIELTEHDIPPVRVLGDDLRISNVGHVTFLIQTQGVNILTDPVWSDRASPFSFAGPKRVIDPGIKFEDLPPIDVVWISHNHYDHLDISTIKRLWKEHKPRIITPLGNDSIIHSHDKKIKVEAYDWGDEVDISNNVKLHLTPMQHWSARGLFDRNKALWSALTIETRGGNVYFIGDSGYGEGRYFKRDKEKFGEFRLALLPMGAYEPRWFMKYAHMNPDDMLKAHNDLGQPHTIPCHYDVFKLTDEGRGEAKIALRKAMQEQKIGDKVKLLEVGKVFEVPKLKSNKEEKMTLSYNDVIKFWFEEIDPKQRWVKDPKFDALIAQRFGDLYEKAARGELASWRKNAKGALAEVIILDQFSRNIFRDTPNAFATDELAIEAAKQAIANGFDKEIDEPYLSFLYMPFMHSESKEVHEIAVEMFNKPGMEGAYDYELKHKAIIDRFGRYPHRNEILGRESTPEEIEFLKEDGSSF